MEPGEYELQVWHPLAREMQPIFEGNVTVSSGTGQQKIAVQAQAPLRLRPESTVPANWDAY